MTEQLLSVIYCIHVTLFIHHFCQYLSAIIMAHSQVRIFRRITRRFDSFPSKTYLYRTFSDENVLIAYEDISERAINLNIRCT